MRILQVVDSLDPVYGGPPTVVLRLAGALALEGHAVTLHSTERPGREADIEKTMRGIPGIERVRRASEVCSSALARLRGLPSRNFMRGTEPYDVVHIHGVWRPSLKAVLEGARARQIPYVITPHGMFARWSLRQKPLRKKVAFALGWRRLTRQALFVHALTQAEARDFRDLSLDVPVDVVPNGCFLEEMGELPPKGTFYQAHPELEGQPFILFLARLHYVKRVDLLVRAFAKLAKAAPDVHLVLAGPDCGSQGEIDALVRSASLGARVHLPGPLYGPSKYAAMVDALCFAQSSVYETFSMSILEAMACGLPTVITRGCNFDEVATSGAGIVVDDGGPGVEDELAQALFRYRTDSGARESAARAARALVVDKYTWPVVARQMLATYEMRRAAVAGSR
jgi:glycosyltransferase involved in cell wall biosynthesis